MLDNDIIVELDKIWAVLESLRNKENEFIINKLQGLLQDPNIREKYNEI